MFKRVTDMNILMSYTQLLDRYCTLHLCLKYSKITSLYLTNMYSNYCINLAIIWPSCSSELWCCVDSWADTNILKKNTISIFRPEGADTLPMSLQKASQPGQTPTSSSPPREPPISCKMTTDEFSKWQIVKKTNLLTCPNCDS